MNRPCGLPNCQGGPATCAVSTGAKDCGAGSTGGLDTSQISSTAASTADKAQGQRGRLRECRRKACNWIGTEGRWGAMARSCGYCGRSRAGDSIPRAWSILSATLKAASNSLTPYCRIS